MSNFRWQIAQWFELRWWQRYLAGKDKGNYYVWKKQYWRDLLAQIADVTPYQNAGSIADLGCGPAGIFTVFEDKKVVAVDPLLDTYEKTLSFFDKEDFPYTTFINQSLEDFDPSVSAPKSPEGDFNSHAPNVLKPPLGGLGAQHLETRAIFDIVFCMNAINHVADIELAYDRMIGAASPDGYVVVSIDAHNHPFFKQLFRLIPGDILHPHQYDLDEYCDFMTKRGCTILKKLLVKKEFFFRHYVVVGKRDIK